MTVKGMWLSSKVSALSYLKDSSISGFQSPPLLGNTNLLTRQINIIVFNTSLGNLDHFTTKKNLSVKREVLLCFKKRKYPLKDLKISTRFV